jgi:predicted aspartyl protease
VAVLALAACGQVETEPERVELAPDALDPNGGGVPMTLAGPGGAALLVPVHVNGQGPWDFILDTGATLTCVGTELAETLALPDAPGTGIGVGLGGGPGATRLVSLDSVRVGPARAMELTGCAVELSQFRAMGIGVHGLLGLNFLRAFRVTLDFERNRLLLEEP